MTPQYKVKLTSHFSWVRAKAHVLEHACWLIEHAVEVGEYVIAVRRDWHASLRWLWAQIFRTCHWIRKRETKVEEMTRGQEWERMLTLHKLGCGEAERPPWMCCIRFVLDPVGGLLCTLLLHWLLGRENLVLETENRKWCIPLVMSQNPQNKYTISAYNRLFK